MYVLNGKSRLCVREIFSPVKLCAVIVCCVVCVDSVFSSVRETRWMSYATVLCPVTIQRVKCDWDYTQLCEQRKYETIQIKMPSSQHFPQNDLNLSEIKN